MSATTWVCAQVGSKAGMSGRDLGSCQLQGRLTAKNVKLGFGYLLFVQRFSERARFGEKETRMGHSGSSRGELEVPAEHE